MAETALAWQQQLEPYSGQQRRMICELATTHLRQLPLHERQTIIDICLELSHLDYQVEPFEFALGYLLRRRLLPPPDTAELKPLDPAQLTTEVAEILAFIAQYGGSGDTISNTTWRAIKELLTRDGSPLFPDLELPDKKESKLREVEAALTALVRLPPLAKRDFLRACFLVISSDNEITEAEADIINAIADAIRADGWRRVSGRE